jgi:flagellar hook-length control protein FliK
MIVVSAKETKEPSGLSQLLLGNESVDDNKFSKFLDSFKFGELLQNSDVDLKNVMDKIVTTKDTKSNIIDLNTVIVDMKNPKISLSNDSTHKAVLKDTKLSNLLQGEDIEIDNLLQSEALEDNESQFLHPKMINTLSNEDLKLVVKSAKTYLKDQIDVIVKEQNIDLKNTPQTLKGLSEMAKKLGVNLEKITLEDISLPKLQEKLTSTSTTKERVPLLDMKKQEPQLHVSSLRSTFITKEQNDVKKQEPLQKALHVKVGEDKSTKATQPSSAIKELSISSNTDTPDILEDIDISELPKSTKVKNEPLLELLQSETESDSSDSVQTKTSTTETKITHSSFVNTPSSDSLEVKVKEAQQMIRHFSSDIKEAVENYKPPFTRLKMTLNPAKLGEVDVTLIQRGNNVHININSNNTALTLLAQNVNELKTQLANNGVVNTSMQFSTSHGEHQQQEGRHQQFQAYKELDQMSEDELDMITSMEIILPRYV